MHVSEPRTADAVLNGMISIGRMLKAGLPGRNQLDPGTFWLLRAIDANGPLRVREVAALVDLDPSTVSRHVAQLEKTGLVDRTPDPADGRAQLIAASPAGQDRLRIAHEHRRELLSRSLGDWDPHDITEFERLLTKFVQSVESTTHQYEDQSA